MVVNGEKPKELEENMLCGNFVHENHRAMKLRRRVAYSEGHAIL
jgi:hypothetical protein